MVSVAWEIWPLIHTSTRKERRDFVSFNAEKRVSAFYIIKSEGKKARVRVKISQGSVKKIA